MRERRIDDLLVDELLRRRALSAALADCDLAGMRRIVEHGRLDERIVQNDVGRAQQTGTAHRNEIRRPRPCTDQIHLAHCALILLRADGACRRRLVFDQAEYARIMPAATVWCVASSMSTNAPVVG
jgi:hypothetical protein